MKRKESSIDRISSLEEYRQKYFPSKFVENPFNNENVEELSLNSADISFKKYKEALHSKHITRKSKRLL